MLDQCRACDVNARRVLYLLKLSRLQRDDPCGWRWAQSGGVLPVGVAGMGSPQQISASLFANWLSLVYMTMAQLGVPHPGKMWYCCCTAFVLLLYCWCTAVVVPAREQGGLNLCRHHSAW